MEILNATLLCKWKLRILTDKDTVWHGTLSSRFGNLKMMVLIGDISVVEKRYSIWWRGI